MVLLWVSGGKEEMVVGADCKDDVGVNYKNGHKGDKRPPATHNEGGKLVRSTKRYKASPQCTTNLQTTHSKKTHTHRLKPWLAAQTAHPQCQSSAASPSPDNSGWPAGRDPTRSGHSCCRDQSLLQPGNRPARHKPAHTNPVRPVHDIEHLRDATGGA